MRKSIEHLVKLGAAGLFLLASCEIPPLVETPEYVDPEAVITVTTEGLPGLAGRYETGTAVSFDGTSSTEGEVAISSYSWDFGDGSTPEEGESLSHTYGSGGVYTVILTVTDANDQADEDRLDIVINMAPEAVISTGDVTLTLGESTVFGSDGSQDTDGTLVSYGWDTGDGTTGSGADFTYTYGAAGVYTAVLTVTDDAGTTDSASVTVTVNAPPNVLPSADAGSDQNLTYDSSATVITVDGTGSTDSDGTIASWEWSFSALPAGSTLTDASLSYPEAGTASFDISGEGSAAMAEGSLTYELTLTVTDDQGGTDSDTVVVTVTGTGTVVIGIE